MRLSDTPVRPIDHLPQMGVADHLALDGRTGTLTYAELEGEVGRLASWLTGFGFEHGSRVATWVAKGQVAATMPMACVRAGLVHVPINPMLKRAQVAHILSDSGALLLIGTAARLGTLSEGDLPERCSAHSEADVAAAMTGGVPLPPSDGPANALAAILYTSGSTGKPKGVMLSSANLWLGAFSVAEYLKLDQSDRVLAVLPLSFDYGQNQLFSTWAVGGCVVPLDYLTARDVVKAVEREHITTLAGVPPLWVQLTEAEWPQAAAQNLRRLTNSGGALSRSLVARLQALFPHSDLYPMYGLTEAFRSTYLKPEMVDRFPESMGSAIPHAEILVCRADGSITDDDEAGELVHCGPLVAQGYWQDEARTAERFRPAPAASRYGGLAVWSGDTVRRDAQGLLTFVGRTDAMIKVAGNRISPNEIEDVALAVAGVAEAVALGVPDPKMGQAVKLYLRAHTKDDSDMVIENVRAAIKLELPNYMMPHDFILLDQMPKNSNGKIDRTALAVGLSA
jgi:acyl-CoA ligase (AMP-forming) (exosortase A-associated)